MGWDPIVDATITVLCDACLDGMGFWIPRIACGFVCPTPNLPEGEEVIFFFFEALCVCAAVHWVADTLSPELCKHITIFMDNTNTVDIFNSLRASPNYNPILKSMVDVMISHSMDLRVLHIPGSENDVADALSHSQFNRALVLRACHGTPLHTNFTHRLHLNRSHHRSSTASDRIPFTYSIYHFISVSFYYFTY